MFTIFECLLYCVLLKYYMATATLVKEFEISGSFIGKIG